VIHSDACAGTVAFARRLADHGQRVALVTADGEVSYRDLAQRVDGVARRLGTERRLVLIAGANDVEPIVAYLAALSAGHPVLLAPGGNRENLGALVAAYDPDVVVDAVDGAWLLDERRAGSAHTLHPDLALLLTTSGTTGSPKLVRLSQENVQANAESIAGYLSSGARIARRRRSRCTTATGCRSSTSIVDRLRSGGYLTSPGHSRRSDTSRVSGGKCAQSRHDGPAGPAQRQLRLVACAQSISRREPPMREIGAAQRVAARRDEARVRADPGYGFVGNRLGRSR
jgi:hypothetical protein